MTVVTLDREGIRRFVMGARDRSDGLSTALLTDHYELTMVQAALHDGVGDDRAAFEVFSRHLPEGRQYGVVAGLGRLLDAVERFRFGPDEIAFLKERAFLDEATLTWLAELRFSGTITAYREGELYFPYSPVLTVEATFAEAVLLETLVLSILNHDSAVASAAARMVDVAGGRPLIEMGSRRTHDEAAVAAARAAHLVGFASTSNLEAGRRHGVPTAGTAAHSFTLAHQSEEAAFRSQLASFGVATTLLVDTYDTPSAIRMAVALAQEMGAAGPGSIRLDSGDLASEAHAARLLLDDLGAADTKIVVSSDLDEYVIDALVASGAPIDVFGVGTRVVTGSGHPTAGFVYKLVAIAEGEGPSGPLRPVAKRSKDKINLGGRKRAWRLHDQDGFASDEHVEACPPEGCLDDPGGPPGGRPLQTPVVVGGERVHHPTNHEVQAHHRLAMSELRPQWRGPVAGEPAFTARPA